MGKWSAQVEGEAKPYGDLTFFSNGQSRFYPAGYVDDQGGPWRVEHNRLIMSEKRWPDWGFFQPVVNRLPAWMRIRFMVNVDLDPLVIQTVTQEEIRLENQAEGQICILRRVPE